MSSSPMSARDGALAKLAAEAARFASDGQTRVPSRPADAPRRPVAIAADSATPARSVRAPAGYVPVAVAPERGNTRPVVPVDGRLHMRVARSTLVALDDVVRRWRADEPVAFRDLERATLVRIGLALALADIEARGPRGAVGEAVTAALDPAVRHTDLPLPDLERWLRPTPVEPDDAESGAARSVVAAFGSQPPDSPNQIAHRASSLS